MIVIVFSSQEETEQALNIVNWFKNFGYMFHRYNRDSPFILNNTQFYLGGHIHGHSGVTPGLYTRKSLLAVSCDPVEWRLLKPGQSRVGHMQEKHPTLCAIALDHNNQLIFKWIDSNK